jgi:hypothetical protein
MGSGREGRERGRTEDVGGLDAHAAADGEAVVEKVVVRELGGVLSRISKNVRIASILKQLSERQSCRCVVRVSAYTQLELSTEA